MPEYYIGVDLGQAADYTAVSVLDAADDDLRIRHLERIPLGTPYPDQVNRVKMLYTKCSSSDADTRLIVDYTGVGRAVIDLIRKEDIDPIALTITGGNQATRDRTDWSIPKRDLVSSLIVAFQTGKVRIARSLPDADTLMKELMNFKLKVNLQTGHDSYEAWREGIHDDLVLSVAMAVYAATVDPRHDTIDIDDCMGDTVDIPTMTGGPVKFEWYNEF